MTTAQKEQLSGMWHRAFMLKREVLNLIADIHKEYNYGFVNCKIPNAKYIVQGKLSPDYTYQLDSVENCNGDLEQVLRITDTITGNDYGVFVSTMSLEELLRLLNSLKNL